MSMFYRGYLLVDQEDACVALLGRHPIKRGPNVAELMNAIDRELGPRQRPNLDRFRPGEFDPVFPKPDTP